MKIIYQLLFIAFFSLTVNNVFAQATYEVSGRVVNAKKEPLKGATVFIGGSDRVTGTDDDGHFKFTRVPPGTFQLAVQLLGYAPSTRNIIVKNEAINVSIQLSSKAISLGAVQIGRNTSWQNNFTRFKEVFLGTSANAKQCVIVNPRVINFSTKKGLLLADADDFLIIENKRLGYRLRYQLEDFGFSLDNGTALYHGQYSFEELPGTDEQKKIWAKNRLETYQGSLMHFLRSVYTNKVLENGFLTRTMYSFGSLRWNPDIEDEDKVVINDRAAKFETMVSSIDTSFKSLKFNRLYVIYDPKKAASYFAARPDKKKTIVIDNNSSIIKLANTEAIIDKKGSYTDYRDFYITNNWAKARVGDQLPVEYKPPFVPMAQRDYPTDRLMAGLQNWTDSIPQEKVYLHMDKPCYAHGDTIWFKGYLTTGSRHELSAISGAVYVDLIDEQNQVIKNLKLPVGSGIVAGAFPLDDNLKDGSYRIKAYTQWMRNAGEDYFFDQAFNVGNPVKAESGKTTTTVPQQTDVQFFPEGGSLINGLSSKIGFKAVGVNGLGVAIKGKVTDDENNEVAEITTLHAGMGNFVLKPVTGKTYTANINFADGTTKNFELPKALDLGYVLSIYQPNKDSVLVRIRASGTLQHATLYLVAQSSGETISATPVEVNSAVSSIWMDKHSFPSGIAQFTLFNANYEPLNERIAFIKGDDQMKLTIKTAKATYKTREHVQMDLFADDAEGKSTLSSISVAVIDASKVPVDENAESTIFSHILLTSDLKGYIEKPSYYFTADTDIVNSALDNLMLTQGYRRFEWKSILDTAKTIATAFKPEGLASSISGYVTTLTHKPVPNANIKMTSIKAGFGRDTIADANGHFRFEKLFIGDSLKFAVQARGANNSDKVIIVLDSIPQIKLDGDRKPADKIEVTNTLQAKINPQKTEQEGQTVAQSPGEHVLKQVTIKTKEVPKVNKDIVAQDMYKVPEQSVDKVLTIPNPDSYNNLTMFLRSNLQGITIQDDDKGLKRLVSMRPAQDVSLPPDPLDPDPFYGKALGIIVNGRKIMSKTEIDEILEGSILPEDIAKIEVVNTNKALVMSLQGGDRYVGYILLFTKTPSARKQYIPSIVNITPKGFNKVRHFYSPKYGAPADANKDPDLRTTIYWNPYLTTDFTGKTTVDFFNADGTGTYRVVVEGINVNGQLGRQVYTYKVE